MIPYGRKTSHKDSISVHRFEGSVIPYGRKTRVNVLCVAWQV